MFRKAVYISWMGTCSSKPATACSNCMGLLIVATSDYFGFYWIHLPMYILYTECFELKFHCWINKNLSLNDNIVLVYLQQ